MVNENAIRGIVLLGMLACAVIGYLLGSVNTAIIVTRLFKQKADIRNYGSGNAGMTNVLRSVGKLPALLTFIGDFLKNVAAVLLGWLVMVLILQVILDGESPELIQAGKYIPVLRIPRGQGGGYGCRHDPHCGLARFPAGHRHLPHHIYLEAHHFPGFHPLRRRLPCLHFPYYLFL